MYLENKVVDFYNKNKLMRFLESAAMGWITVIVGSQIESAIYKICFYIAIMVKYVTDLRIRKIIIDELSSKRDSDSK